MQTYVRYLMVLCCVVKGKLQQKKCVSNSSPREPEVSPNTIMHVLLVTILPKVIISISRELIMSRNICTCNSNRDGVQWVVRSYSSYSLQTGPPLIRWKCSHSAFHYDVWKTRYVLKCTLGNI